MLVIWHFAGWAACGHRFLWSFGILMGIILGIAFIEWWRNEDEEGFVPWEYCGTLSEMLSVALSGLGGFLATEDWRQRLVRWPLVLAPLLIWIDMVLPVILGALATIGFCMFLEALLHDADKPK